MFRPTSCLSAMMLCAAAAATTSAAAAAGLPLAKDGAQACCIVRSFPAPEPVRFAADELQRYLWEITGVCPYVKASGMGGRRTNIVLACPEAWATARPEAFAQDLQAIGDTDGFAIRTVGSTIYIVANEPKGVLNGVYDFLERNTDIVFHRPNAQAIFGHNPDLTATHADYRMVPAFIQRGFQINVDQQYEPSELWLARNRNNTTAAPEQFRENRLKYGMWQTYGGGHNLKRWIPPRVYGESNPDFFPMINGKRDVNGHNQLCFTNPRLLDEMTRLVLEQIDQAPHPTYYKTYNIMNEDCNGLCECPECQKPIRLPDGAMLPPDDPSFRSTQHYIFMNEVARRVAAIHPKVKINTYAYMWSVEPPKIELSPSVTARFCTVMKNDKESINGPSNTKWIDLATRWSRQKADLIWREYYGLGAKFCRPVAEVVAEDLRTIRALGFKRAFSESAFHENPDRQQEHHPFDVSAMEYWVISRLYWDPDQDVKSLRDDFLKRTFREACAPMKTFYDAIREKWYATAKASTFLDNPVKSADYYIIQAGIETLCRDALTQAEALAVHPESRRQVKAVRNAFEYWMAEAPKSRTPEITVPKIKDASALADVPWQINGLNRMNSSEPARFHTRIRLAHDMDNLFVDFAFDHPAPDQINGVRPPQPEDTWPAGEHVEFFLDGALADQAQYYFFVFNAFGVKWDGVGTESGWDGEWSVQTEILAQGWTARLVIPMATIGVNVTQRSKLNGTFYKQTNYGDEDGRTREHSSWGGAGLHSAAGFGQFVLEW